ncbi:MAG: TRP75-related protein [Wolbachia endosymbiont of Tyrophagus putrescentiae]|nr:TRP75-related protein [Wolbachia endosymbiont of Tyrophagus putrescentiae]
MFRDLFKILFILICLVIAFDSEAKSKLSKKYTPPGNPGGDDFYADEEFAESYNLYKKRRELLKKKKLQGKANTGTTKGHLNKELKSKKIVNFYNYQDACLVDDEKTAMLNKHGVNVARLKGAVFIDNEDKQESVITKLTSVQEKRISPVKVVINDPSPKRRVCSHDSIADLKVDQSANVDQGSSFGSIVDTTE